MSILKKNTILTGTQMTKDDLISMHKTCEVVIESISLMSDGDVDLSNPSVVEAQLENIRQQVTALAVVQRELLASFIKSMGG
jgi:hypothetical protein